jgi:integral membrane sensor domain MASE1
VLILWGSPVDPFWQHGRVLESVLLLGVLLLVSQVVFVGLDLLPAKNYPLEFLFASVLTWVAVRSGIRSTAIAIMAVSAAALVGTLRGYGPFARESTNESLLLLQVFMGIMALTSCTLAAAVSERQETLADMQHSTEQAMAAENGSGPKIAEFLHSRVRSRLLLAWNRLGTTMQC